MCLNFIHVIFNSAHNNENIADRQMTCAHLNPNAIAARRALSALFILLLFLSPSRSSYRLMWFIAFAIERVQFIRCTSLVPINRLQKMAHLLHDYLGRDFMCIFQFRMFVGFIAVAAIGAEIWKNTDVFINSTAPAAATTAGQQHCKTVASWKKSE